MIYDHVYQSPGQINLIHIIVALAGILLTSLLANLLLENQFRQYIKANLRRQNQRIVAQIAQDYDTAVSGWNHNDLTEIGMNALSQGLILKLTFGQIRE